MIVLHSLDEFFHHAAVITQEELSFSKSYALERYCAKLREELAFYTYYRASETICGFVLREGIEVPLRFRCNYLKFDDLSCLSPHFYTAAQARDCAGAFFDWRCDELVLNVLVAVGAFLQRNLVRRGLPQLPLLEAAYYYFTRPPVRFEPVPTHRPWHRAREAYNDIFCNIFNALYYPEIACLTSYDVSAEVQKLVGYIRKNYQARDLADLLRFMLLRPRACTCDIKISNLIQSTAVTQSVQSAGIRDFDSAPGSSVDDCELLLRGICVLRQHLEAELETLQHPQPYSRLSLVQLLAANKAGKERCLDAENDVQRQESCVLEAETPMQKSNTSQHSSHGIALSHSAAQTSAPTDYFQFQLEHTQQDSIQDVRMTAIQQQLQLLLTQNQEILMTVRNLDKRVQRLESAFY